jgi:hypothetical protein
MKTVESKDDHTGDDKDDAEKNEGSGEVVHVEKFR